MIDSLFFHPYTSSKLFCVVDIRERNERVTDNKYCCTLLLVREYDNDSYSVYHSLITIIQNSFGIIFF